jgi:2-keto-4-pentenoate hydratase/2-oxohepta-3-ene-1,7-dioic acid hydratase in catechol pathway
MQIGKSANLQNGTLAFYPQGYLFVSLRFTFYALRFTYHASGGRSPMILLTFRGETGGEWRLGVKTEQGVLDVAAALGALSSGDGQTPATMEALLAGGAAAREALAALAERAAGQADGATWLKEEAALQLGPPVSRPGKIICVGLNYRRHAAESGLAVPETPVLFSKFANAVAAPGEPIPLPDNAVQYDYEVELAAVIGRRARYVSEGQALDYVLGYCTANDLSARDLQTRTSQWLLGKTLDKFMPLGPYLVTADQVPDPQNLALRTWVNGELRQNSNTSDMVFSVAQLVSYVSQYITLEPGDVILTGTPEGVILGMKEKVWLKAGDEVTLEVEGLGRLTNSMI